MSASDPSADKPAGLGPEEREPKSEVLNEYLEPPPRVLVVHGEPDVSRMLRESLASFRICEIDSTPSPEYAFELALQRKYKLFIFSLNLSPIGGDLLYQLLSTAYTFCHEGERTPPAVIYVGQEKHSSRRQDFERDSRVKGLLIQPVTIDLLLQRVGKTLPERIL